MAAQAPKRRIAITGGICEGKSTVCGYLRELGYAVANADEAAREVFEEEPVQRALALALGCEAPVSRQQVRDRLALDPDFRRTLNRITHPRILERLDQLEASFVEVPLLVEACLQGRFDRVWVVTCGPEEQLRRLAQRLGSKAEARRLMATQLPTRAKIPFADAVIRTNRPESDVQAFVAELASREFAGAG
ncbi:MAG TPA: dephospho-CoA kinase [Armatimonadetes bacterium]|nr:dephospho-CoA kinase [Armatimonadota bacterium]HCE01471.1 dephospho-CoA kinase [Armatimonadota bacterium]